MKAAYELVDPRFLSICVIVFMFNIIFLDPPHESQISTEMEKDGADMMQVCVLACQVLEDNAATNAGTGCNLSFHGCAEADALICDSSGCSGAVAAVPGIRNPIIAASLVHSNRKAGTIHGLVQPNLLVGQGARDWVEARMPSLLCSNDDLLTNASRAKFQRALHLFRQRREQEQQSRQDTVGVVMMRGDGFCCCAISSGGTQLKSSGRVGHAALVGAGGCTRTFGTCSVTACCTGTGEDISERYLAYRVAEGIAREGPEDWVELSANCFEVSSTRTAHLGCIGLYKAKQEQRMLCSEHFLFDLNC
jgi:isoaspartyl peptidase/L-asparaginase-like protein (Ntn-hydrolase superfamily)